MEMPAELRHMPPRSTLDWVAASIGPDARVVGVRRLHNAWAAAMHAVDVDDNGSRRELVVRRWARADIPPDPGVVENEAAALSLLTSLPEVCTPALIALDPAGDVADVPALVMTRLRGHDVLSPSDIDAFLDGLVEALRAIHAAPLPEATGLGPYVPWGLDDLVGAPSWSRRPDVWRRAIEIAHGPVPAYTPVLCHRDFHPGNVLWHRGRVSGVVDWTHTCLGPAAADIAHCRENLALLFGLDVADEFARRYGPVDDLAWFDLVDVVGAETPEVWRWHDAGRTDLTLDLVIRTYDALLAAAVDRLS
jgi:aminoglycoside phosphotransferase (APT) family kinase protein